MHLRKLPTVCLMACLVAIFALFISMQTALAALSPQDFKFLAQVEQSLFSVSHANEPVEERLNRLEFLVLGAPQPHLSPDDRFKQLKTVLIRQKHRGAIAADSANATEKISVKPTDLNRQLEKNPHKTDKLAQKAKQPHSPASNIQSAQNQKSPQQAQPDPYLTVTVMEQLLFAKAFQNQDVAGRLTRLELRVFGVRQKGTLQARVDNLKLVVLGDTDLLAEDNGKKRRSRRKKEVDQPVAVAPPAPYYPASYSAVGNSRIEVEDNLALPGGMASSSSNNIRVSQPPSTQPTPTMLNRMAELETKAFKQTYPNEPIEVRLDRLEMTMFGQKAPPGFSTKDRLERLDVVTVAQEESPREKAKRKTFMEMLPFFIMLIPLVL
ncbi:MAG: hypothetical protein KTR14_01490 [Vampirovibrio sp.]|nr:hypothetical protein [Vampirovibrio sp.]